MNIFSTIRQEINDFVDNYVEVVPGYTFNQYETIKKAHLYYNSKFLNQADYNGRTKLFFNIVKYRCEVATRMLNFDTKDIRLLPLNPKSEVATFLLEKELKMWLKNNKMGKILNDMASELPIYGSVVLKKTKTGAKLVDLRRLFLDPTVENILDSRFITIKHYLTESELRAKKKDGWDSDLIDKMIFQKKLCQDDAQQSYENDGEVNQIVSSPYYEVYERYGELPESVITGKEKDTDSVRTMTIVADVFDVQRNDKGVITEENGKILFKSKWHKEYPFKDAHYSKTRGRWLGIGVIEELFPIQERQNEIANQKRVSMELSSMHLFQIQGKTILSNILNDLQNGDILPTNVNQSITPIVNEERNLPAFSNEENRYDTQADRMSFAYDTVRGEGTPSSTPATNAVLQNNNASSVFAFKRENFGLMLRDYFNDLVLPQLEKDLTPEHIMRFMGSIDELKKLDKYIIDSLSYDSFWDKMFKRLNPNYNEIKERIKDRLKKKGVYRFLKMKENFYKDIEFEFDFNITNEQIDIAKVANNLYSVLTALAQNPQMLQDPRVKRVFFKWAEAIGISPVEMEIAEEEMGTELNLAEMEKSLKGAMNTEQPQARPTLQTPQTIQ